MVIRKIHQLPDSVLRQKAKRISAIDSSIQRLIDDMVETMRQANGVGLAAPQVGVSLRIVVVHPPGEELITLINPKMVKRAGERGVIEGCLSIPGYTGEIKRSVSVTVKGQNRQGKAIRLTATDLMAQALEHELDHLNGILYIDHLENQDKFHKTDPEIEQERLLSNENPDSV